MREIKFRTWNTIEKKMVFAPMILPKRDGGGYAVSGDGHRHILMQYSGLKDKKGEEIYEGDIVQAEERWTIPKIVQYEILFEDASFIGVSIKKVEVLGKGMRTVTFKAHEFCDCEIIGDIYQNPELLS